MEQTLATEVIQELRTTTKRWFVAFLIMLILLFGTIGLFVWYISLPVDNGQVITQAVTDINHSTVNQKAGGH